MLRNCEVQGLEGIEKEKAKKGKDKGKVIPMLN